MKRMMWTMGLTLVLLSTNSLAANVIRDGKGWLQPVDFLGLTWSEVEAVCPEPDFLCDGQLNGIDVTGFTFASVEQFTDLFNSYDIDPPLGPAPANVSESDSAWAPIIMADFTPTFSSFDLVGLECISSTTPRVGFTRIIGIGDYTYPNGGIS